MLEARAILPIVGVNGQITHWRCSFCSWTTSIRPEFMGLAPSESTLQEFELHKCEEHQGGGPNTTESGSGLKCRVAGS
ncbi:MAG: hypothetical protein ACRD4R_15255 [Candidatus Acidiferrales bacterium]